MARVTKRAKPVRAWVTTFDGESLYNAARFHRIFIRRSHAQEWADSYASSRIARVEIREVPRKLKPRGRKG